MIGLATKWVHSVKQAFLSWPHIDLSSQSTTQPCAFSRRLASQGASHHIRRLPKLKLNSNLKESLGRNVGALTARTVLNFGVHYTRTIP